MTEDVESVITDQEYENNITLSYEYIEKSIKEVQEIINHTNTQLGVLIGFNFTFIRFFISELPNRIVNPDSLPCNSCILLKLLAYTCSIASIIVSLVGLYQTIELKIINPSILIQNCDKVFNWELKLAILNKWQDKLDDFKKLAGLKKKIFNRSIIFLVISVLMAIINRVINSIFYGQLV